MTVYKPSVEQSEALLKAFDHFNDRLFDGKLTHPMLVITRNKQIIGGYFSPNKWGSSDGGSVVIHEIAINANVMTSFGIEEQMNILCHEMLHQWQEDFGKPTRAGYHNKEWAEKAKSMGLQPKSREGKETGQAVGTEIIPGGKFEEALGDLPEEAILPWQSDMAFDPDEEDKPQFPRGGGGGEPQRKAGVRSKYTCPKCGLNAWAKPQALLACGSCVENMVEAVPEAGE